MIFLIFLWSVYVNKMKYNVKSEYKSLIQMKEDKYAIRLFLSDEDLNRLMQYTCTWVTGKELKYYSGVLP